MPCLVRCWRQPERYAVAPRYTPHQRPKRRRFAAKRRIYGMVPQTSDYRSHVISELRRPNSQPTESVWLPRLWRFRRRFGVLARLPEHELRDARWLVELEFGSAYVQSRAGCSYVIEQHHCLSPQQVRCGDHDCSFVAFT